MEDTTVAVENCCNLSTDCIVRATLLDLEQSETHYGNDGGQEGQKLGQGVYEGGKLPVLQRFADDPRSVRS